MRLRELKKVAAGEGVHFVEPSAPSQKLIDNELERPLPGKKRQRVFVRGADHGMWSQQPEACRKAVLDFLRGK